MVSSCKFTVSAIAALTCLVAVGCAGDKEDKENDPFAKLQNKPPIIVKGSLTWTPQHAQIQRGTAYIYFVKAIDPDIGDKVVRYSWRFEDGTSYDTTSPTSLPHIFDDHAVLGSISVMATDDRGATGEEVQFEVPLVQLPSEPLMTLAVDGFTVPRDTYTVAAGTPFVLSFRVADAGVGDVSWKVSWGDDCTENGISSGVGATVTLSHPFASEYVGKTLTATIEANDQKNPNIRRTGTVALMITK